MLIKTLISNFMRTTCLHDNGCNSHSKCHRNKLKQMLFLSKKNEHLKYHYKNALKRWKRKENPRAKLGYILPYLIDKESSMCDEPTGTTTRGTPPLQRNKGGVRGGRGSLRGFIGSSVKSHVHFNKCTILQKSIPCSNH
jgi:hypothetical protein